MAGGSDTLDQTLVLGARPGAAQIGAQEPYAGRYRIERLVGRGGMGAVYLAHDVVVGDVVALKILDGDFARAPQTLDWFRREVRLARRISHPNVARTHDMGEHAGSHFISMEFIEGATLEDHLYTRASNGVVTAHAFAPARAAAIAAAVCEGLVAAHAAGVVHRDLKPANILIERTGRVVITDFGIARGVADEGGRTQGMVGTPLYMAPEQVAGQPVDARTDLYALGLVLFEMLAGRPPFYADSPLLAATARLEQPPPDLRDVRPDVPEPLAQLVLQCMSREPGGRPAGAAEVAARLRPFLTSGTAAVTGADLTVALAPEARADVSARLTPSRASALSQPAAGRALAVLPLRYQGPPDHAFLGDAVTDELIDVLSRTRGLKTLGSGATARFRDNRDPRAVGGDLGVDAVVDATLQYARGQVRVIARLVEVATGMQLWSDRFEARADDPFDLPERVGKRIAEALRVELTTAAHRHDATPEAIALFQRARRKLYAMHVLGPDSAVELFEACLAAAPQFKPAIAGHAVTCVRAWFVARALTGELLPRDLEGDARRTVARAVELAPDIAETHLARAMLSVQLGDWQTVAQSLSTALEIAPAYAHAHQYLAQLQCEAGNVRDGVTRARLAAEIEPTLILGLLDVARAHALRGELEDYERIMGPLEAQPPYRFPTLQLRIRVATWYGDKELPRQIVAGIRGDPLAGYNRIIIGYARASLGDVTREEMDVYVRGLLTESFSPRLYVVLCQLIAEVYAARGYYEESLRYLRIAADSVLTDLDWVDRCPLLAPVRELPGFAAIRKTLHLRVDSMWVL